MDHSGGKDGWKEYKQQIKNKKLNIYLMKIMDGWLGGWGGGV